MYFIITAMILSAFIVLFKNEYQKHKLHQEELKYVKNRIARKMLQDLEDLKEVLELLETKKNFINHHNERIENLIQKSENIINNN